MYEILHRSGKRKRGAGLVDWIDCNGVDVAWSSGAMASCPVWIEWPARDLPWRYISIALSFMYNVVVYP